jgi:AcrR family transcriptional regulator
VSTPDTRTRVLDVAERLFAQQGFAETSLRNITSDAGVNLAAVNYHFGSKDALLFAVLERRIGPINQERLSILDQLEEEHAGGRIPLEDLVEALVGPPMRAGVMWDEGGAFFRQIADRVHSDQEENTFKIFLDQFKEVFLRFYPAFQQALPELPEAELLRRVEFMIGGMIHSLTWGDKYEHFKHIIPDLVVEHDPETLVRSLVTFAAAGLRAPAVGTGKGDES